MFRSPLALLLFGIAFAFLIFSVGVSTGVFLLFMLTIGFVVAKSEFLWFEVLLSIFTVVILTGIATFYYPVYLNRAKISELFMLMSAPKIELVEHYAYTGAWAGAQTLTSSIKTEGLYSENIHVTDDGAIHGRLKYTQETLTLYPVTTGDTSKFILWQCGYQPVPLGENVFSENRTDISPTILPLVCRNIPRN